MSDAERQLLFDEIHQQFRIAISYNLYTGLAYGAHHHHPRFMSPAHLPAALQGCFSSCTSSQSGSSCEWPSPPTSSPQAPLLFGISSASSPAPKDPCSALQGICSCSEAQRLSLCWLPSLSYSVLD